MSRNLLQGDVSLQDIHSVMNKCRLAAEVDFPAEKFSDERCGVINDKAYKLLNSVVMTREKSMAFAWQNCIAAKGSTIAGADAPGFKHVP